MLGNSSEVFRLARTEGPQRINRQGKEGVAIISAEEYSRLIRKSPLVGIDLDLERDKDVG